MKGNAGNIKKVMGSGEAAECLCPSKSAFINIRKRDKSFPEPFKQLQTCPIWLDEDILDYGKKTGKFQLGDIIPTDEKYSSKKIAVIGKKGVGKSFVTSMFARDSIVYRRVFSGFGNELCDVSCCFVDTLDCMPYVEFRTDYHRLCDDVAQAEDLNETRISLYNEEKLKKYLNKVASVLAEIKQNGEVQAHNKLIVYAKPSTMAKNIIRKLGVRSLEIIDSSGFSSAEEVKNINADMYIYITDGNDDVYNTVNKLKGCCAMSDFVYMYRGSEPIDNVTDYNRELEEEATDCFKEIDLKFKMLQSSLIGKSMPVINPLNNIMYIPPLSSKRVTESEKMFCDILYDRVLNGGLFDDDTEFKKDKENIELDYVSELCEEFWLEMYGLIDDESRDADTDKVQVIVDGGFSIDEALDNYKLKNIAENERQLELAYIYDRFARYNFENCDELWQQRTVVKLYKRLTNAVKHDNSMGVYLSPDMEYPNTTLSVIESILAKQVISALDTVWEKQRNLFKRFENLSEFVKQAKKFDESTDEERVELEHELFAVIDRLNEMYRRVLKDNGVKCRNWDKVYCQNIADMGQKLDIIAAIASVRNYEEIEILTQTRYICGLWIFEMYKILGLEELLNVFNGVMDTLLYRSYKK